MTLEDAIKHYEGVIEREIISAQTYEKARDSQKLCQPDKNSCDEAAKALRKCADEHKQLMEWLRELKVVHDEIDDADDEDEIFIGYLRKKMRGK